MDVKEEPIDSVEEEVASEEAVEVCHNRSKTKLGPNKKGSGLYARYCEFGNTVALDHYQMAYLKAFCVAKKPTKPVYICTLQTSHVIKGKGKMYFTKKYTNSHLRKHLHKEVNNVKVTHHKTEKAFVKMKLISRKGDRKAMMTTEWMSVVNEEGGAGGKFKKGDIMLFWIRRANEEDGGLKVIVKKLLPCEGC